MSEPSPIVSGFGSPEDERAYQHWFGDKVAASLADDGPTTEHAAVMAELDDFIERVERVAHPNDVIV